MTPLIFNINKPVNITSYDVIRKLKKSLIGDYGKIGHFGTLDPFACGVLLVGIGGASRLNEYVHNFMPKTYLAIGKLGVHTETGDLTVPPSEIDTSLYFKNSISSFDLNFLNEKIPEEFLGEYMQAPHKFSAAKFEGRKMYEWSREGIDVLKEKKKKFIHEISIVKYSFPYLIIRTKVSSGTYVRTLFKDIANYLGTYGTLVSLVREKIGDISLENSISIKEIENGNLKGLKLDEVLSVGKIILSPNESKLYKNGNPLKLEGLNISLINEEKFYWVYDYEMSLIGLGTTSSNELKVLFNLRSN